ncbi:MAG: Ig-like domain-containing protein, partial [Lachnospiraceae bacterium]|nr:Ig-like domain-containing protein [Lachnospiraceae bacterium]
MSANISGVGIKVVSGTAVYAAGTAEGTTFTTAKLPNGTYEFIVSKAGYDDVVVPVVVNGDVAVTAELKNVSLAVSSVKAINAKQIEVKFNNTMDRATVEKDANFDIKPLNTKDDFPTRNNISDITLQDDAKTAIITLHTQMTNGYEYEVTVNKEVKSAAGKNLTEKSVTKVVSNDSTRPTTTSIKTLAPNLLQVTFSEPVWIDNPRKNIEFVTVDSTGKELDDKLNPLVNGDEIVSASNGETSYVIHLNANLKQGSNYNLYVGGGNGISDYAELKLTAEKHTFTYEADKEVTAVKNFTLLDGKTAKVSFTKPIDLDNSLINVYYNVDGVQGNQIAIGKVNPSTDAQSIKVTFDKLIPGGVKYFFVDGAYDLAGNKVEIGKFNITVPEYKAAEVSSVKLSNKTTIEVEFNQEIDDDKSYFNGDLTHDNKVRANIVLKDKDGKNVDIKKVEVGKDSKNNNDYAKRIITLYKDLGEGNNTLTIDNLVDELGRAVVSYKGTVSYANSTEFSAKLKAGKTDEENDKTVAVLSIDESKAVPTQASVENLKNWTVDTTYGKKTLAEVAGARVKMVSNDVYLVEADKDAFKADSAVVLSNLETATGLTIPSTTVDAGDAVSDIKELAKTKGDVSFDGTTATINLKNVVIGSFSPSDFIIVGTKENATEAKTLTPNEYT